MLPLTMRLVTNSRVRNIEIVGTIIDSYCVVAIVGHQVRDTDVGGANIESICVEWKTLPFVRYSIDNRIRDVDVTAANLNVPSNGLARLQTFDTARFHVENHQMRASSNAGPIRRVGIPPLLSVGVDPAVVWVLATRVVNVRALEVEPPDSL